MRSSKLIFCLYSYFYSRQEFDILIFYFFSTCINLIAIAPIHISMRTQINARTVTV